MFPGSGVPSADTSSEPQRRPPTGSREESQELDGKRLAEEDELYRFAVRYCLDQGCEIIAHGLGGHAVAHPLLYFRPGNFVMANQGEG